MEKENKLKYIEREIEASLENCAALGRDAYGQYIENLTKSLMKKIKTL